LEFKVNEECGGKISFEISNLITLCPHRKYDEEDITELKLTYKPWKWARKR